MTSRQPTEAWQKDQRRALPGMIRHPPSACVRAQVQGAGWVVVVVVIKNRQAASQKKPIAGVFLNGVFKSLNRKTPRKGFSAFSGVSRQGEFKNTTKMFLQKVHVENFSQKYSTKISRSVFPRFVWFIAFSGVSQPWELKSTTKNVLQKNRVEKLYKKINKNPKPFFLDLFSCFWAFLGEGSKKKHH
jgi:hypothetical protein